MGRGHCFGVWAIGGGEGGRGRGRGARERESVPSSIMRPAIERCISGGGGGEIEVGEGS